MHGKGYIEVVPPIARNNIMASMSSGGLTKCRFSLVNLQVQVRATPLCAETCVKFLLKGEWRPLLSQCLGAGRCVSIGGNPADTGFTVRLSPGCGEVCRSA